MKKVKFIVFICLFILLPLAYFNGFIRISDLTSEQESIAKKYGGVYVFDEKLEKEIDKLEELNKDIRAKRSSLYQEIKQELDNNQSKYFQEFNNNKNNYIDMVMQDIFNDKFCKQKYDEFVAAGKDIMKMEHACININERARGKFIDEIVDKTYHVYDRLSNGKILNNYEEKLKEFMGKDYDKYENYLSINLGYFYIDNDTIIPISIGVSTLYTEVTFGLYGDEASGIKFTKESTQRLIGDNKFYLADNKFQKSAIKTRTNKWIL